MEILDWIQDWFQYNCDGKWEKGNGIQITTSDVPGWEVEIDLSNTSMAHLTLDWILNENSKQDWYGVKVDNQTFSAACDSGKLEFILNMFKEMIEKLEN
ncbi:MAG: hypothetical protein ACI8RY_000804 [Urechidicola sp.]|jgi:hypothetical protein|tara:strand:+ start:4339 stop:4635 length:297 start_codon:yes stop_codon:yes gene_type:complete